MHFTCCKVHSFIPDIKEMSAREKQSHSIQLEFYMAWSLEKIRIFLILGTVPNCVRRVCRAKTDLMAKGRSSARPLCSSS